MSDEIHKEIVLVGGPNDGERHTVARDTKCLSITGPEKKLPNGGFRIDHYWPEYLKIDQGRVEVWVHKSWRGLSFVWGNALVNGYRKAKR